MSDFAGRALVLPVAAAGDRHRLSPSPLSAEDRPRAMTAQEDISPVGQRGLGREAVCSSLAGLPSEGCQLSGGRGCVSLSPVPGHQGG